MEMSFLDDLWGFSKSRFAYPKEAAQEGWTQKKEFIQRDVQHMKKNTEDRNARQADSGLKDKIFPGVLADKGCEEVSQPGTINKEYQDIKQVLHE